MKKLEFNWRMGNYGFKACPERLVRLNDDEENVTINFLHYYDYQGKELYCSVGYFWYNTHEPCWEFKFVGDRFIDIPDDEIKPIFCTLKLAYKTLEEWTMLNVED